MSSGRPLRSRSRTATRSTIRVRNTREGSVYHLVFEGSLGKLTGAALASHVAAVAGFRAGKGLILFTEDGRRVRADDDGHAMGLTDGATLTLQMPETSPPPPARTSPTHQRYPGGVHGSVRAPEGADRRPRPPAHRADDDNSNNNGGAGGRVGLAEGGVGHNWAVPPAAPTLRRTPRRGHGVTSGWAPTSPPTGNGRTDTYTDPHGWRREDSYDDDDVAASDAWGRLGGGEEGSGLRPHVEGGGHPFHPSRRAGPPHRAHTIPISYPPALSVTHPTTTNTMAAAAVSPRARTAEAHRQRASLSTCSSAPGTPASLAEERAVWEDVAAAPLRAARGLGRVEASVRGYRDLSSGPTAMGSHPYDSAAEDEVRGRGGGSEGGARVAGVRPHAAMVSALSGVPPEVQAMMTAEELVELLEERDYVWQMESDRFRTERETRRRELQRRERALQSEAQALARQHAEAARAAARERARVAELLAAQRAATGLDDGDGLGEGGGLWGETRVKTEGEVVGVEEKSEGQMGRGAMLALEAAAKAHAGVSAGVDDAAARIAAEQRMLQKRLLANYPPAPKLGEPPGSLRTGPPHAAGTRRSPPGDSHDPHGRGGSRPVKSAGPHRGQDGGAGVGIHVLRTSRVDGDGEGHHGSWPTPTPNGAARRAHEVSGASPLPRPHASPTMPQPVSLFYSSADDYGGSTWKSATGPYDSPALRTTGFV